LKFLIYLLLFPFSFKRISFLRFFLIGFLFGSPVFLDYLVFVERSEYKQKKKGRIQNKEDGEDGGRFIILDRSLSFFFFSFFFFFFSYFRY
jgi:cell division protein FtsI/penicillin-binding protein 2